MTNRISLILLTTLLHISRITAGDIELKGQVSIDGFATYSNSQWNKFGSLRYIPQIAFSEELTEDWFYDMELSLNMYFNSDFETHDENVKLYRLKLRFATPQAEIRAGLQKINFGPAIILRSLRWFDKLDPRDPLSITDGVYGLRFKYNFLNNSSLTLWGLYNNKDTKGYELVPSSKKKPEFGGRYLFPLFEGETGITFHTRTANLSSLEYRESKIAIDGRWDIEVGLWFESVIQKNEMDLLPYKWQNMTTLGSDYTFDIGNGLYILAEHMRTTVSEKFPGDDLHYNISAVMLNYPYTLVDNFRGMIYYSWDEEQLYKYIQWQRMYDNFTISVALFHYPEGEMSAFSNANIPNQGYGAQLTFIYNH